MDSKKLKKGFAMPDTYVIIVGLIVIMIILTHILPAGQYDYSEDGKTVVAGTYHEVESNPAGLSEFLNAFYNGLSKGASTIFLVFLIGGAFQILTDTGSIDAALATAIRKTQGNYKLILPVVIVVMSILGALGTGNNVALAFAPVMIILCGKMGLDSIVVAATMYFASNCGFAASPMNPFTVLLGQDIAGIQPMSGMGPRIVMWFIFTGCAVFWTIRYCGKIKKDPAKSFVGTYKPEDAGGDIGAMDTMVKMKPSHIINLIILAGVFIVYAWGGIKYNWGLPILGAAMMVLAFLTGIVGRMGANGMAKSFVKGAEKMVYSALLIGFASAINVIMTDAKIIHTIIYGLTIPLQYLTTGLAAIGMFIANFIFNFFIPSGSGQVYVVMPLMAPMADILGITRQVAISAFQFGDGLCNVVIPTSGLLMGCLGIARVPYQKWLKFAVPITLIMSVFACIFLVIMNAIGWS